MSTLDCALRDSIREGALATVMGTLLGGVFLTGFLLHLGADELQIGVVSALPALANLAQLPGAHWIGRTGRSKSFCLKMTWLSRSLWLPILLLPAMLSNLPTQHIVWSVIGVLSLSNLLSSAGGVAWLHWIKCLMPAKRRLTLLSQRDFWNTGLTFGMSIGGAVLLDSWAYLAPDSQGGFVVVFLLAMICGWWGATILHRIPAANESVFTSGSTASAFLAPLHDARFRRLIGCYALWNLSAGLASPFFVVFMLQQLHLPFWAVTLLATLSSIAGLMMNRIWTRLRLRYGIRPVVCLAMCGDVMLTFLWTFVSTETLWMLVVIHGLSLFAAPLSMGSSSLVLKLAPETNSSPYLAVFNAITGPLTAVGAVVGGLFANWPTVDSSWGQTNWSGFQCLFHVSAVGRLASIALLQRVAEPDARTISHLCRSLLRARRFRKLRRQRTASLITPTPTLVPESF